MIGQPSLGLCIEIALLRILHPAFEISPGEVPPVHFCETNPCAVIDPSPVEHVEHVHACAIGDKERGVVRDCKEVSSPDGTVGSFPSRSFQEAAVLLISADPDKGLRSRTQSDPRTAEAGEWRGLQQFVIESS